MTAGEWWSGLAWFVAVLAGAGTAATLALRAWGPALVGATRALAWSVLATAALLAVHVVPAALGVLGRPAAVAGAAMLALAAWRLPRREVAPTPDGPAGAPEAAAERAFGALIAVAGGAWLLWAAFDHRLDAPEGFDAATAYLPTAARWIQRGSLWGLGDWLPGFFFGASPGNGSMLEAAAMLPWRTDAVARQAMVPFVALTALGVRQLAREAGGPAAVSTGLGVAVAAVPVVVEPGVVSALLDPVLYAMLAAGLAFLLRHHRTGDGFDLALAGTALGIAFGTKLYGFTAVPIVVAVWVGARCVARTDRRAVARDAGAVVGLVAAFGGVWVLRNLVATGNPVFPVSIGLLGFDAPADPVRPFLGSTLLDYLDEPSVWTGTLDHQLRIAAGLPLAVVAVGVAAALVVLLLRRSLEGSGPALAGVVLALLLAVSYAATPYSALGPAGDPNAAAANVRYGIPALIAGAGVVGWLAGRAGPRVRWAILAVVAVAAVDALREGTTLPTDTTHTTLLAGVPILAVGWAVVRWAGAHAPRRRAPVVPAVLGLAVVVLALGLASAGQRIASRYDVGRYQYIDPALDWLAAERDDATIGLAGSWSASGAAPTYPAFGARLQREVVYVGPTDDGLLGTFTDAGGFGRALDDDGIQVLLVGRNRPFLDPAPADPSAPFEPPEVGWATASGFVEVFRSVRFVVLLRP